MSRRILIVDDEAPNRKLLQVLVTHEGFIPVEAQGGEEALRLLENEKFDLVLLDMMMPGVDGISVLRRLRELEVIPGLPVVVVTAHSARELRLEALALGAIDFVTKPVDVLDSKCRMRTLIELGRLREQAAEFAAYQAEAGLKARIENSIEELPLVLYQSPRLDSSASDDWSVGDLEKLTGVKGEVAFGALWRDLVHPEDQDRLDEIFREILSGSKVDWHLQYRWGSNQQWVSHVGQFDPETRQVVGALMDITETKELEARYLQSQKMEAVGQLDGGIAHDFNNLLCAIISFAGFALDGLTSCDQRRADIEEVLKAANRAAGLTRQLLTFSRRKRSSKEVIDLNERLCQLNKLLTRSLGERIFLEVSPSPRPAQVEIDPIQFDQVLLNLSVNARDAMPDGGRLRISVNPTNPDDSSKEAVVLTVADTGHGMSRQTRERIFEPFFTTKEVGRGTGLGLATTLAIVEQAEGTIEVQSVEGEGTTFVLQWPLSQSSAPAELPRLAPTLGQGHEVLVVEDEASLRRVTKRVLEGAGYQVFTAADGEEAKCKVDMLGSRLSVIVTDVVMPKVGGFELAEYVRGLYPQIPIVFVTGYMDDSVEHPDMECSKLLWKPFQREELLRAVGDLLGVATVCHTTRDRAQKKTDTTVRKASPPPGHGRPTNGRKPRLERVLFLDDDEALCQAGVRILEPAGFAVNVRTTLAAARKALAKESFEAIIMDINLPDGDGFELLTEAGSTPVVVMTGAPTADTARRAVQGRVQAYLPKPVPADELRAAVRQAVDVGRVEKIRSKLLASRHGGDELIENLSETEETLERALSSLTMHYQPIVRGRDNSIYGYEALLRSKEPKLNSPLKLLAAAEVLDRVEDVGRAVRASVANSMREHSDRLEVLFVNLHPLELNSDLLAETQEELLRFAPRVILEVTERASLQTGPRLTEELRKIRGLGYRLAVDDLGEGYAGLSSLVTVRPDIVKIDMSLVRDLHKAPLKIDIVSAIVEMAHQAGITVVGEGIEVLEERDVLVALGCDLLQGYYLGKPAPPFCELERS